MGIFGHSMKEPRLKVSAYVAATVTAVATTLVGIAVPAQATGTPTIASDQADYTAGSVVTLSGTNWTASLPVHIRVDDSVGATWKLDSAPDPVATSDGSLSYKFTLPTSFIATYSVAATQAQPDGTTLSASTTFTDSPPKLDQCANGSAGTTTCTGNAWVNGDLNAQKSQYFEGDSVPYRLDMTGLTAGNHTVTIAWDVKEQGYWAFDYLTTFDRTEAGADPCDGGTTCNSTTIAQSTIPTDTQVAAQKTNPSYTQIAGQMSAFTTTGSTVSIINLTYGSEAAPFTSTQERSLTISFTTTGSHVVLAWAGHLATRADWGTAVAVTGISGAPYHMRLKDLDNTGGNQDRSLQADAVIFPGKITITKVTDPTGSTQSFPFTDTGLTPSSFSLTDGQSQVFDNLTDFTTTYTVTEGATAGWQLNGLVCNVQYPNGGTRTVTSPTVSIKLGEGEYVTCTYTNVQRTTAPITVSKTFTPTFTRTYSWDVAKLVNKTRAEIAEGGSATFDYTVRVTHASADSAWAGSGTITLTNTNPVAITGVDVVDSTDDGLTCTVASGTNVTVPAKSGTTNGTATLNYSCTYAGSTTPADGTNTATASWPVQTSGNWVTAAGSASGTHSISFAVDPTTIVNGSTDVYDTKVTQTAPGTKLGTVSYTDPTPKDFTYSLTFEGVAGTCTPYDNTASLSVNSETASQEVTVCVGKDLTVTKTAAGTYGRTYLWKIAKDVDQTDVTIPDGQSATFHYTVTATQTGISDAGWTLGGTITVSNPNDWEPITADVTDVIDNGGACTVAGGTAVVIPKGESVDLTYSCSYGTAPNSYSGTNTATATWNKATAHTPTGTASGTAEFTLTKAGSVNQTIHVTDSYAGDLGTVTATDTTPYATGSFTYDRTESGVGGKCTTYDNTATITETAQTASQTVTLCVAQDLTVTKTASGTFNREYLWKITKDVDNGRLNIADGDMATFNYTVKASQTGISDSGWTVTGTITVTNPNDFEAITADVTDAISNGGTCTVFDGAGVVIPKGGSVDLTYTCTYGTPPSSYTATNTGTATWDKAEVSTPNGSATGSAGVTLSQLGSTNKTVTVTDSFKGSLGTVTATDSEPWTTGTFTYSRDIAGVGGTCTTYDNTATISETGDTASQTVKVCVGLDLTVAKTASGTFDREYLWKIAKSVDDKSAAIADGDTATFHYTVDVTQTGIKDSGWTASGTITVSNPNDWEDITADVTDTLDIGGACDVPGGTDVVVPMGGSVTVSYSCSFASAPSSYSGTNTGTATWDKATAFTPSGSASGEAALTLTQLGSTNKTVHVTDSYKGDLGTVTATDASPWATGSFTYDRTESGVAGTCTTYDNTATITETKDSASQSVKVCVGKDLTVSKTAAGSYGRTYLWDISKDVNKTEVTIADGGKATFDYTVTATQTGISDAGWGLSGEITVTNPNDWQDITAASVLDDAGIGGICNVTSGTDVVVPKSGSVTLGYSCSFTTAPTSYTGTNTATATWDKDAAHTPTGTASGTAPFTLTQSTSVNKTIHVTDTLGGNLGTVTASDTEPFTTKDFTYSKNFTGVGGTCTKYDNTATITETSQSASETVTVCAAKDLAVSKTAAPSFTRTYLWDIAKSVDTTFQQLPIGPATFNYTVDVTQTGISDSGWKVTGTITVTNPNDFEAITTDVTDAIDNGGTCAVTGGTSLSIPASGSKTLDYTCTYTSAPSPAAYTNTATAAWDQAAASTPNGSASGDATGAFGDPTSTVNKTITVTDTFDGTTETLGTVTGTDSSPWASKTFTYPRSIAVPFGICVDHTNTATIVETGQNDSVTVTVCGPAKTGALTIGFWQNKNGQKIITNGSAVSGVCTSGTWLRGFAPFQDLSSTAKCSAVASYVTNVIKAANASGSSMNAMLKAQMLATALDVYFSSPALGGNQIGAPAPIGGLTVDLTKICKHLSNGTCSGTVYDVSAAFGGATSMKVIDMLTYAASKSNVGGSLWYGNVKSTQEMAKDAFDAINNQQVFIL